LFAIYLGPCHWQLGIAQLPSGVQVKRLFPPFSAFSLGKFSKGFMSVGWAFRMVDMQSNVSVSWPVTSHIHHNFQPVFERSGGSGLGTERLRTDGNAKAR